MVKMNRIWKEFLVDDGAVAQHSITMTMMDFTMLEKNIHIIFALTVL